MRGESCWISDGLFISELDGINNHIGEELGLFSVLGIETQIWIGHNPSCIDLGTFHFYRHGGF